MLICARSTGGEQLTRERHVVRRFLAPGWANSGLLLLFLVRLVALFTNLVLFGGFFATGMRALFALSDCFVATIISVLLAFDAELMFLVCLDAAFVVAFLAFGLRLDAAALTGECGVRD